MNRSERTPGAVAQVVGMVVAAVFIVFVIVHGTRHDARIQRCYDQPTVEAQNECMEDL